MELQKAVVRNYDRVAKEYAEFNFKKEQRAIIRSKKAQLKEIHAGDKVLFAGSGPGEDCMDAARQGAQVTCVDVSERMLAISAEKFKSQGLKARFICANIMEHTEHYDVVIANYFLNIFDRPTAQLVLTHLASRLKPQGVLMIADLAPLKGNLFYRMIHYLRYLGIATFFATIGLTAFHVPYEYEAFFSEAGLKLKWQAYHQKGKVGPLFYKTWAAKKL